MTTLTKQRMETITVMAIAKVQTERARQIDEEGYSREHDDEHRNEELAAAAAFFLVPDFMNQDVCTCTTEYGLVVQSLHELIGENAWLGIQRDDTSDLGIRDDVRLDTRIHQVTKGLALGIAELERLLRMRETVGTY
ncbi:MAG: hypothetical protein ACTHNM_17135 [Dyella sp.]|uniref:hypothetical protein n=1 Tax=Dyella sp. TaxID=1869338 RepID=UPI003F81005D